MKYAIITIVILTLSRVALADLPCDDNDLSCLEHEPTFVFRTQALLELWELVIVNEIRDQEINDNYPDLLNGTHDQDVWFYINTTTQSKTHPNITKVVSYMPVRWFLARPTGFDLTKLMNDKTTLNQMLYIIRKYNPKANKNILYWNLIEIQHAVNRAYDFSHNQGNNGNRDQISYKAYLKNFR